MTPELIGILGVGAALFVGLGGLILTTTARTDARLRADIASLRADVHDLASRVSSLEQRMSRVEGLIEGLFIARGNGLPAPTPERGNE
ncbi:MAG: hypothetical protein OXG46_08885 [Chloroflexi bacterium]|nr:hypothetical protein [Chloroflexota bacterium]MCY3939245.1 hypothetical protein [Chloroflexota bacterium]